MKKTFGGERLGSGNKMQVDLHGYERSTHDLGYIWRSSMSAGTLVPFMSKVALPGDTWDINLDAVIKTHPTIGPLFGSYKVQLDVFMIPIRLYIGKLHNNTLGIGLKMNEIKFPVCKLYADEFPSVPPSNYDINNSQINPSCILAYLGIRGIGYIPFGDGIKSRDFNALPWLMYWDIYKNYYANKQEEVGAVIHTERPSVEVIQVFNVAGNPLPEYPSTSEQVLLPGNYLTVTGTTTLPVLGTTKILSGGVWTMLENLSQILWTPVSPTTWEGLNTGGAMNIISWDYALASEIPAIPPKIEFFDLSEIDGMREEILAATTNPAPFVINETNFAPWYFIAPPAANAPTDPLEISTLCSQEGLGLKTYQSDMFNNWLKEEWISGAGGINEITAIDTSGGSFTIDTLNLSKKVYDMLNRIAVSGGSYDDWIDAVYTHDRFTRIESPVYMGGLIKELVFQEVVSNSASETNTDGSQPLGTLAGKGVMSNKHKGGSVYIKVDEPSYIMGIISLTPRIDYSQGNQWDVYLSTIDNLHKPALDEIGFQNLPCIYMAWWDSAWNGTSWANTVAGKQPAWLNYMTDVNVTYGNFAIETNEMFMTLNRRYEFGTLLRPNSIKDLTTYIDPSKFNNIFAQTSLDSQNFWAQIAVDITCRRKMSAKIMPNL